MSNSNYAITKVTVDPVSQEITNLEVNGERVSAVLQEKTVNINTNGLSTVSPDEGYDGISSLSISTNVPTTNTKVLVWDRLKPCDYYGNDVSGPQPYIIYKSSNTDPDVYDLWVARANTNDHVFDYDRFSSHEGTGGKIVWELENSAYSSYYFYLQTIRPN